MSTGQIVFIAIIAVLTIGLLGVVLLKHTRFQISHLLAGVFFLGVALIPVRMFALDDQQFFMLAFFVACTVGAGMHLGVSNERAYPNAEPFARNMLFLCGLLAPFGPLVGLLFIPLWMDFATANDLDRKWTWLQIFGSILATLLALVPLFITIKRYIVLKQPPQ